MVIKFPGTPIKVKRTQAPTAKWSTSSGYSEKSGWRWSPLSVDVIPTVEFRSSIVKERSVEKAVVDQLEFIHNNTSSTIALVEKLESLNETKCDGWIFFPQRVVVVVVTGPALLERGKNGRVLTVIFFKGQKQKGGIKCWKRLTGCLV